MTTVALGAGESETIRYEVEAEAIDEYDEEFRVILSQPSLRELSQRGVAMERSWTTEVGSVRGDWPDLLDVDGGEIFIADFSLTLTNTTDDELRMRVVVTVMGQGAIGYSGSAENLRLEMAQR